MTTKKTTTKPAKKKVSSEKQIDVPTSFFEKAIKTINKYGLAVGLLVGSTIGYLGIPIQVTVFPAKETVIKRENTVENLVSFVKSASDTLGPSDKSSLINAYNGVLEANFNEGYEIREALRAELTSLYPEGNTAVETFGKQVADRIEQLNPKDDINEIKNIYRQIVEGLTYSKLSDQLNSFSEKESELMNLLNEKEKEIVELKNKPCPVPTQTTIRRR